MNRNESIFNLIAFAYTINTKQQLKMTVKNKNFKAFGFVFDNPGAKYRDDPRHQKKKNISVIS